MWKSLFTAIANFRRNQKMTVTCDKCKQKFNTDKESGLCPHIPIRVFIYGKDKQLIIELTDKINNDEINIMSDEINALKIALHQSELRFMRLHAERGKYAR